MLDLLAQNNPYFPVYKEIVTYLESFSNEDRTKLTTLLNSVNTFTHFCKEVTTYLQPLVALQSTLIKTAFENRKEGSKVTYLSLAKTPSLEFRSVLNNVRKENEKLAEEPYAYKLESSSFSTSFDELLDEERKKLIERMIPLCFKELFLTLGSSKDASTLKSISNIIQAAESQNRKLHTYLEKFFHPQDTSEEVSESKEE